MVEQCTNFGNISFKPAPVYKMVFGKHGITIEGVLECFESVLEGLICSGYSWEGNRGILCVATYVNSRLGELQL